MSVERAIYIDSSALIKLAVQEPQSAALRRYLRRHGRMVSSALARTEVARALLPKGPEAVQRGQKAIGKVDLLRVNDRILTAAGELLPVTLRSLDAIHLATAQSLGDGLARLVTYDQRLTAAAKALGLAVAAPK